MLFFIQKDKNFAIVVVLMKCVKFKRTVSNSACSAAVVVVRYLRARVHTPLCKLIETNIQTFIYPHFLAEISVN